MHLSTLLTDWVPAPAFAAAYAQPWAHASCMAVRTLEQYMFLHFFEMAGAHFEPPHPCQAHQAACHPWPPLALGAIFAVGMNSGQRSLNKCKLLLLQLGAILVVGVLDGTHGFNFSLLVRILASLLLAWPIAVALAAGLVAT